MKTLGLTPSTIAILSILTLGCDRGGADEERSPAGTSGGTQAEDDSGGGGSGSSSTGEDPQPDPSDSPLAACTALPEATAAGWTPGMLGEPSGALEDPTASSLASWTQAQRLLSEAHADGPPTVSVSPISTMGGAALAYARHGEVCGGGLQEIVGFGVEGNAVHEIFGGLLAELGQRDLEEAGTPEEPISAVELALTPSIWSISSGVDEGTLAPYGAALHALDGDDYPAMNTVMNCAIEQRSNGLLVDFLPDSIPSADTTALDMLISYLAAPWATPLEDRGTLEFSVDANTQTDVPAVGGDAVVGAVYEDEDILVVDVPLRGEQLEVTFMMPKSATLPEFLAEATAQSLIDLRGSTAPADFDLEMPRVETQAEVVDVIDAYGLECDLFTVRTLLTGAAVTIDAAGVAAAGAGAAESWASGTGSGAEFSITIDRPYLFFIVDRPTQTVLFNGRFAG